MSNHPLLSYAHHQIEEEDITAATTALRSESLTRGKKTEEFEHALASYCGARFAVTFNSGTSALSAAIAVIHPTPFDRVFCPNNTFVGTLCGALLIQANSYLVDVESDTGNISLEALSLLLAKPHSRGKDIILPVHFAGQPIAMEKLEETISRTNTIIIEDAAHALGSRYPTGEKVGSCAWSTMTAFSFHASKTITTGEGGAVTTNDSKIADQLRLLRNNGIHRFAASEPSYLYPGSYEVEMLSGNFHLTEFQAALGLSQLQRIDALVNKRQELLALYQEKLAPLSKVTLLSNSSPWNTAPHLAVVLIDFPLLGIKRTELMEGLAERGIETQVHYPPLSKHPLVKRKICNKGDTFPQTERYFGQALSLPLHLGMQEKEVERVVKELEEILSASHP